MLIWPQHFLSMLPSLKLFSHQLVTGDARVYYWHTRFTKLFLTVKK